MYLGTDCTGLCSIGIALMCMHMPFRHIFGSECDLAARVQLLGTAVRPEILMEDIQLRDWHMSPTVDLYVCGFPCQAFSKAGGRNGFEAETRAGSGRIFFYCLDYIKRRRPRAFILENVEGLESIANGSCMALILKSLYRLPGYNIYWQLLNTKEHGIPHNRPRYYFVGIRQHEDRGTFSFPTPVPMPALENFLEPRLQRPTAECLPAGGTASANVRMMWQHVLRIGGDPSEDPWVLDCDSSVGRAHAMFNCSPCLTRSRFRGHWLLHRGRRMTLREMSRLPGVPSDFPVTVPATDFCQQMGNMMSVNVLRRLLASLLPAAGLDSKIGLG